MNIFLIIFVVYESWYSLQVDTYGLEIMKKLNEYNNIHLWMSGLGVEKEKKVFLMGLKEICIYDENKVKKII